LSQIEHWTVTYWTIASLTIALDDVQLEY